MIMRGYPKMKLFCVVFCLMVVIAEVAQSAPSYGDYENSIRDLYELLLQKEALEERLGAHQMVRKAGRSPSLRLRFGRRSDPSMLPTGPFMYQAAPAQEVDRAVGEN